MIWVKDRNLLFLEIPKNATTTIAAILLEQLGGERVFSPPFDGAPSWSNGLGTHLMEWGDPVPEDVTFFVTIRNPLSRAFSMWRHFCVRHAGVFGWPPPSAGDPYPFEEFAWWLATHPEYDYPNHEHSDWHRYQSLTYRSQAEALQGVRVDKFLRVEKLEQDLGRVGIPAELLREVGRRNVGQEVEVKLSGAATPFIHRWSVGDFNLLRLADENRSWRPI